MEQRIHGHDDNGEEVELDDYVISYYNVADGVDSRGDREDVVHIRHMDDLMRVFMAKDSNGRMVEKISKELYEIKISRKEQYKIE